MLFLRTLIFIFSGFLFSNAVCFAATSTDSTELSAPKNSPTTSTMKATATAATAKTNKAVLTPPPAATPALVPAPTATAAQTQTTSTSANNSLFSVQQIQKIEQVIHDYLLKNPKVMIEVIQELQKQAAEEEQKHVAEIKDLGNKHKKEIFDTTAVGRAVVGGAQPKVIVAEFVGYQCPVCRDMAPIVDKILQNNKDIQIIFIPWTFEGNADIYAAQTALAASRQPNKFMTIHKSLLALSGILTKEQIDKVARSSGLDMMKLNKDRDDKAITDGIKANFKLAQDLNLIGTPAFFITNAQQTKLDSLPGKATFEEIQQAINEVR